MQFKVRRAIPQDFEGAVAAEQAAMKSYGYLKDTAEMFYNDEIGPLLVAEDENGKIVGVAKYTVVYDGSAWLETLRVEPQCQRQGIGRMFYDEFVKLSHQLGVKYMRMYTGAKNIPSASLARIYGLETEQVYREMNLNLSEEKLAPQVDGIVRATPERACELLRPLAAENKGFLILNRTFYKMCDELYKALAAEGKVYEHPESGSVIVLGNRFLPRRSLQIGIVGGNKQKMLDFAKAECIKKGRGSLIVMFPPENEAFQALLEQNGYAGIPSDLMVMGGEVK